MSKTAIVIVTHNRWPDTQRCLRSLRRLVPLSVTIVVDNASTDCTVAATRAAFPEVTLLAQSSNTGYAAGNNIGVQWAIAQGARHVLILNNDTEVINPEFIEGLRKALASAPTAAIAGPRVYREDGSEQNTILPFPSFPTAIALSLQERLRPSPSRCQPRTVDAVSGVCMLVDADAWTSVGGLDQSYGMYGEEIDFAYRVKRAGRDTLYAPINSIVHYHRRGEHRGEAEALVRLAFIRFCWYHRGWPSRILTTTWLLLGAAIRDLRHRRVDGLLRKVTSGLPDIAGGRGSGA